ncbi:Crp/Fnr family transcriptional regulator [Roseomonas sp. GCM10028921]
MLRLEAGTFRRALDEIPALRTLLLRYTLAFQQQVAQTAACNGHHALDQRLARWLLMAHDRAEGDEFPMTQEFLAMMLCVHRPGVTLAARLFQQAGLIRYGQGQMRITDREGLEGAACECYATVRYQFQKLLGAPRG